MYDITIVGSGVSGIFLAYTLMQTSKSLKILMIEKGKKFSDRICPIERGQSKKCIHCNTCDKCQGFGGMGRSEGKFNYTNDFGGSLGEKIGNKTALTLMEYVDDILCLFGGDKAKLYSTNNDELNLIAKNENYSILTSKVRHLGTSLSYEVLDNMYLYLKDNVDIKFKIDITSIEKYNNVFTLNSKENIFQSKIVILSTGISGGTKFLSYCNSFNIKPYRKRVDLGVRVEMKKDQLDSLLKHSFEIKLNYKDDDLEATTYCMNPKGKVIRKFQNGLVLADGQNYLETDNPSCNLNFSILTPKYFNECVEANEYAESIIKCINRGDLRIVIQRLEDLIYNRITTKNQLIRNSIHPSLKGEGGNLYDEIPKIYIDALLKTFKSIEIMMGKDISEDTLLYGIDAKFYEPEIYTNKYFESKEKGLYVIGDCSGTTYSLSQSAASAVYLGRYLLNKPNNNNLMEAFNEDN